MDADVELLSSDPDSPPPSRPAIRPSRAIQAASLAAAPSTFRPAAPAPAASSRRSIYPPPSVPLLPPNARAGPSSGASIGNAAGGGRVPQRTTAGGENRQAAEEDEDESDIEITRTVSSLHPAPRPPLHQSTSVLIEPSRVHGPSTLSSSTSPEAGPSRGAKGAAEAAPGAGRRKKKGKVLLGEAAERTFRSALVDRQKGFGQLAGLDKEIASVENQLATLSTLLASLKTQRATLSSSLSQPNPTSSRKSLDGAGKGKGKAQEGVDYLQGEFEWEGELKEVRRSVFGIERFRLCQAGVCNAVMDGRDVVAIMPTGGGKSLCYQLPALLSPGTTVVISPLVSLITDQILHLEEQGIACAHLTSSLSTSAQRAIFRRLVGDPPVKGKGTPKPKAKGGKGKGKGKGKGRFDEVDEDFDFNEEGKEEDEDDEGEEDEREVKLLYVTPEKVAKSKLLGACLQKMHTAGTLARIVIDEAHCVSQLGHDFRPDYKKLSILRQLYPGVPMLAVTATCSRRVLPDLLRTLGMKGVTSSDNADASGTVFFNAPLYRPNLLYKVVPKSAKGKELVEDMAKYVLEFHKGESGIVYCLSKKDAEDVAAGLKTSSGGKIRTGVYHADVGDEAKAGLHAAWREGKVQVVVATIAFGLGIDKGDVRFVMHHSISKSLDGYYQETGRAGRDGKEAACILFYRSQDVSRMASLTMTDAEGQEKLHDMIAFAQDLVTCRKILFGRYFSTSAALPSQGWSEEESKCGHCDNCLRNEGSFSVVDCTLEAWKICRIADHVVSASGRVTISTLADLARGLGGGAFDVVATQGQAGKRKRLASERSKLDLGEVGGKVTMSKEDVERLIIHLLLKENGAYLEESFAQTAYTVNVYIQPSPRAIRLTRLSLDDVQTCDASAVRVECAFPGKPTGARRSVGQKSSGGGHAKEESATKIFELSSGDEEEEVDSNGFPRGYDPADFEDVSPRKDKKLKRTSSSPVKSPSRRSSARQADFDDSTADEDEQDDWEAFDAFEPDGPIWETVVAPSHPRQPHSKQNADASLEEESKVDVQKPAPPKGGRRTSGRKRVLDSDEDVEEEGDEFMM